MNVFVLCTGRCGSTTFTEACTYMTNYTAAHESRTNRLGDDRLDFPDQHIEVDNRLSWFLGRLDQRYGDEAFYVHLKRNEDAVAKSFSKRMDIGIMKAYRGPMLKGRIDGGAELPMSVSRDYCETVTSNIELFLRDKTRKMAVELETITRDFPVFWERIGAQGDLDAAIVELSNVHNASQKP